MKEDLELLKKLTDEFNIFKDKNPSISGYKLNDYLNLRLQLRTVLELEKLNSKEEEDKTTPKTTKKV